MKLKNDWTLAHLLYYLSRITAGGIVFLMFLSILFSLTTNRKPPAIFSDLKVSISIEDKIEQKTISTTDSYLILNGADGRLTIDTSDLEFSRAELWLYILIQVKMILVVLSLYLLSKVFESIFNESPFDKSNPFYLYCIGWIFFFTPILEWLTNYFLDKPIMELSEQLGLEIISVHLFGNYMLLGIFMIVIGYVFKEGNRLKNEQELTI